MTRTRQVGVIVGTTPSQCLFCELWRIFARQNYGDTRIWLAALSYFKLVRVTSECADSACWLDMLTRSADSTLQFVVSSCHYKLSLRLNVAIWHYDMMLQKEAMEWNNKLTDWLNEMTVWCNGLTMQNESLMRWFIDLMQRFIDLMRRFIVLMRQIEDLKRQIDWWIMSHIWLHISSSSVLKRRKIKEL